MLYFFQGSEYQELQVTALADTVEFSQSTSTSSNRYPASEQPDGALVTDALPHAARLSVAQRVQGMVLKSANRNDRGQPRVQRKSGPTSSQGSGK